MSSRIAYFLNQYPAVSHSFIRREIKALERRDYEILRIALRGWDAEVVDAEDEQERLDTLYVLKQGLFGLSIDLVRALVRTPGHFLSAFALTLQMSWQDKGRLFYHFIYLAEACRALRWFQSFGATHVHAHFGTNSAEVVMLARVLGGPSYSFTVHGPVEFDMPMTLGIGEKVKRAAFVAAVTSFTRSQLFRWIEHREWTKVRVIHCGLERTFHDVPPTRPPATPRLLCIGRLVEQKGQLLLIQAAARLAEKGVQFELVLVGDGEMRTQVEALVTKNSLDKMVRLTGSISTEKMRQEILSSRALVLASFAEGLPGVIMEAMALRRPVLATYVAGIPELVRHGVDGWLFPAGSIDALMEAIEDCLSRTEDELWTMGNAAHDRVLERHSVDVQAKMLDELIREGSI